MKSSIPVFVDRPSRHAATTTIPGPLHMHSVGVTSKLEGSGGFSRNRRTIHPHVGVAGRRRQHELTISATHEMHLPPREVRPHPLLGPLTDLPPLFRGAEVLATTSQASMHRCHKFPEDLKSLSPVHQPLPLRPCHTSQLFLCQRDKNRCCLRPQVVW